MAGVVESAVATWSGGTTYTRVDIWEAARNNAAGWVDIGWWHGTRDTHGSVGGTWDWSRSGIASGSGSVGAATGTRQIGSGTTRITCDANGNFPSRNISQYLDVFYGTGSANTSISPGRAPLAPTNIAPVGSNIKTKTATITAGVSSHGHGTSSTYNIRYRKQGDASWTERGYGTSTWNVTGLKAGTTYEMASRAKNNMGDEAAWTSGTYTFKTKPAASFITIVEML